MIGQGGELLHPAKWIRATRELRKWSENPDLQDDTHNTSAEPTTIRMDPSVQQITSDSAEPIHRVGIRKAAHLVPEVSESWRSEDDLKQMGKSGSVTNNLGRRAGHRSYSESQVGIRSVRNADDAGRAIRLLDAAGK